MKYFLIFTQDRGGREDCSVYYSDLVGADSEEEAFVKYFAANHPDATQDEIDEMRTNEFEALEMNLIQ